MTYEAWNAGRLPEGAKIVSTPDSRPPYLSPEACKQFAAHVTAQATVDADAKAILNAMESAIQRFGAGRLARALAAADEDATLQTIADYAAAALAPQGVPENG